MLSISVLCLTGSHPLNAINFVFYTDIVRLCSVIIIYAELSVSSVLDIMTSSSANNIYMTFTLHTFRRSIM
jgi:hypothetical protein